MIIRNLNSIVVHDHQRRDCSKLTRRVLIAGFSIAVVIATGGMQSSAQQPFDPPPPKLQASQEKEESLVELQHGMPRSRVLDLMGPPSLESVIGSLGRARVTYQDDTELLFEDDRLIAIQSPIPTRQTSDGRLALRRDGMTVVYPSQLELPENDPLPDGPQRHAIDDGFYFGPTASGPDPYAIPFTPATPQCLLDDCPGCGRCAGDCIPNDSDPCNLFGDRCDANIVVQANALFLYRDSPNYNLLAESGSNAVGTSALSHGLAPGLEATLQLNLTGETFVELGYLGLQDWSTGGVVNGLLPAPQQLSSQDTYDAELNDLQINLVHYRRGRPWSLSWGVRAADHQDSFSSHLRGLVGAGNPPTQNVDLNLSGEAENRLLGLQVGTRHWYYCGPLMLTGGIKAGVLHNEIRQSGPSYNGLIDLSATPTTATATAFTVDDEEVTFLGDFEFTLQYAITRCASARIGYRGLALSNIAQSAQQQGQAARARSLEYHGVFAGTELRW